VRREGEESEKGGKESSPDQESNSSSSTDAEEKDDKHQGDIIEFTWHTRGLPQPVKLGEM
jgi:hypothetical protein